MFKKLPEAESYSEELKRSAIKYYISQSHNEFDYTDLADAMGMTYMQLRKFLVKMKQYGDLFVVNGILCVENDETIFQNEMKNLYKCDIVDEAEEYIPRNFHKKFNGYT